MDYEIERKRFLIASTEQRDFLVPSTGMTLRVGMEEDVSMKVE